MHVEHVLSSIMNRVAAQIRDPDEENSDFVFWFFLVAGFNFFTLKTKLVPFLEPILVPKMEPCLVPPLTKPYVENQFWFSFLEPILVPKKEPPDFSMSSSKLFQLLVKKEAANGFPVGALFLISGGSPDGRWGSEPMSKFHFLLKFSNQSLHPCVFASALNDANMQTLSDNCPHLLQGYTCSTWAYCRHFLIEVAYPTMTRPRVSAMLMQTNICCNSGMRFMSICFVRDHDVCLMQCVWNDVPLFCMIGSVVQAHGKKRAIMATPTLRQDLFVLSNIDHQTSNGQRRWSS